MKRRKFFQSASMAVVSVASLDACRQRADLLRQAVEKFGTASDDFVLNEITVEALQEKMGDGSETARSVAERYLQRIAAIDQSGPALNAVIELNPDVLSIADELDRERAEGKSRGPLHGIPVLIKDNIDSADKMQTTAGSLALVGAVASQDSQVVKKLREAGAVILGKSNLSEWANFRSFESSSGWSSRGGQTKTPYILNRNPCGSSSGSAVAVAANLCALAIGTETNGSIVCPSSVNGVVGIKPTVGLIGRSGIIPISETQDTAGPMARTVKDAAILLGALTGVDDDDQRTLESEGKSHRDYLPFLMSDGLKEARIGVGKEFMGFNKQLDRLMNEALEVMKEQGAELIDVEGEVVRGGGDSFTLMLYEFKAGLNRYLAAKGKEVKVKSLADVITFNRKHAAESMPYFQQEVLEMAESKGDLKSQEYVEALDRSLRGARKEGIDRVMDDLRLDAITAPTGGPAWVTDLVYGDRKGGGGSSSPAARAGYPNITLPMGMVHGLPVGLSFFGRAWSEATLLKMAYAYEQASGKRMAPTFRESV